MQATRERILYILKERRQATVDELSQELGLTAVTIRHHLEVLRTAGFVAEPVVRRRETPGRPQHVYVLTEKAGINFPRRYDHLATLILREVRAHLSSVEEMSEMMEHIGEHIAGQATLPDEGDFEARLAAVADFLDELGYMARWERRDDETYLLHIANCPYEKVATQDRAVCTMDLSLLTSLLGASPRRISWAAQDDDLCTYAIRRPGG